MDAVARIGILSRQGLNRRIPGRRLLRSEVAAWRMLAMTRLGPSGGSSRGRMRIGN
jgi:hypothetical protein